MKKNKVSKSEEGALIVEASIVFPIMLFIIIFLLYLGNAYYQKCRIEKITVITASDGAAYVADPVLKQYYDNGNKIPEFDDIRTYPYRYIIPAIGKNILDSTFKDEDSNKNYQEYVKSKVEGLDAGFYKGMNPHDVNVDAKLEDYFVFSKVTVSVKYTVDMPIKLFDWNVDKLNYSTVVEIPVSDVPEFVRNIDFVEDIVQQKTGDGFDTYLGKLTEKIERWKQNHDM